MMGLFAKTNGVTGDVVWVLGKRMPAAAAYGRAQQLGLPPDTVMAVEGGKAFYDEHFKDIERPPLTCRAGRTAGARHAGRTARLAARR